MLLFASIQKVGPLRFSLTLRKRTLSKLTAKPTFMARSVGTCPFSGKTEVLERLSPRDNLRSSAPKRGQFVPAHIFPFCGHHLWHGCIRFAVIVICVPEKKPDSALILGRQYLSLYIFWRICLCPPGEGLQPRADYDSASLSDLLKPVHGFSDEMFGRVARTGNAVHSEEV